LTSSTHDHHFEANKNFITRNRPSYRVKSAILPKQLDRHTPKLEYPTLRRISVVSSSFLFFFISVGEGFSFSFSQQRDEFFIFLFSSCEDKIRIFLFLRSFHLFRLHQRTAIATSFADQINRHSFSDAPKEVRLST